MTFLSECGAGDGCRIIPFPLRGKVGLSRPDDGLSFRFTVTLGKAPWRSTFFIPDDKRRPWLGGSNKAADKGTKARCTRSLFRLAEACKNSRAERFVRPRHDEFIARLYSVMRWLPAAIHESPPDDDFHLGAADFIAEIVECLPPTNANRDFAIAYVRAVSRRDIAAIRRAIPYVVRWVITSAYVLERKVL